MYLIEAHIQSIQHIAAIALWINKPNILRSKKMLFYFFCDKRGKSHSDAQLGCLI